MTIVAMPACSQTAIASSRFWNVEVLNNLNGVCETIVAALDGRLEPYERFKV